MIKRLKEVRLEKKKSQRNMADFLNITQQTYSDYETGRTNPDIDTLSKIADFLETTIDYLVGRSDDFGAVTIYANTDNLSSLSIEEQKVVDSMRKNPPLNATDWMALYAELPKYLQENLFAELKGAHLAFKTTKTQKKENSNE